MDKEITPKKVYLITTGCQMNEYDTELIKTILAKEEFVFVNDEFEADVVMLNTCAIRENAHRKVYGRVHEIHHKREGKPVMIGILGCMATNLRKELFEKRNLRIDFIAGPDSYKRLPEIIRQSAQTGEKSFDVTLSEFETYSDIYPSRTKGVNAWIAVMRGCNNFCSFCVVPYTRGRERSRGVENIAEEVRLLTQEGFKQVTLLGQNVNSYYADTSDFADLLESVSHIEGIERIRFTSPHPKDFPDKLLRVIAENPKICKHIHLPLQSGNNRVLDLMNRTYTQGEFLSLIDKIRGLIPGVSLSTDIIVGFPTETDEEFLDTVKVIEEVRFDSAFIFKYSQRKGTMAERQYPDDVPEDKKTRRIIKLNEIQREISLKRNRALIGSQQEVLIEQESTPKSASSYQGRTDGNKIVIFPQGPYQNGDRVRVNITEASYNSLKGFVPNPIKKTLTDPPRLITAPGIFPDSRQAFNIPT